MAKADIDSIRQYLNSIDRAKAARFGAAAALVIVVVVASLWFLRGFRETRRLVDVKKEDIKRFSALEAQYLQKREAVEAGRRKASAGAGASLESIMEEIGNRTGSKIVSIKTIEERDEMGYLEKEAEVRLEGVELNNLINFLYNIETSRALIIVREFSMKSRFEDPNRLDVRLRVSHVRKG